MEHDETYSLARSFNIMLDKLQLTHQSLQMRIDNIKLKKDIPAMKGNGTLSVSVRPDNDEKNVTIKINDTGSGIAEKDIRNIFEPFFTTRPVGGGTGLGLSVCHSLVQEHKGEIEVKSELGKGTAFIVRFPQYKETA